MLSVSFPSRRQPRREGRRRAHKSRNYLRINVMHNISRPSIDTGNELFCLKAYFPKGVLQALRQRTSPIPYLDPSSWAGMRACSRAHGFSPRHKHANAPHAHTRPTESSVCTSKQTHIIASVHTIKRHYTICSSTFADVIRFPL